MDTDDESNARVGEQLAARRDQLGMTQAELAERVDVNARSVGSIERGQHAIRRSRRQRWEDALYLQHGTISHAYRTGSDLEMLDEPPSAGPESWDRIEWELYDEARRDGLAEEDARERVQIFRTHVRGWPMRRDWTPPDQIAEREAGGGRG